jgi:fructose/tagatose bisphosphate aldolase
MHRQQISTLKRALAVAERGGYALGAFSPRCTPMIRAALRAGQQARSPLIVQISSGELRRYDVTPEAFAEAFYAAAAEERVDVPLVLHLDHTKSMETIAPRSRSRRTSPLPARWWPTLTPVACRLRPSLA